MAHTGIIATIGSASESADVLAHMMENGLTIARLNMSHGDYEEHDIQVANIKKAQATSGKTIEKLFDLAGPKIRVGIMEDNTILVAGEHATITTVPCVGTRHRFSISYERLPSEVTPGTMILLADGKRRLEVVSTNGTDEIECIVRVGGLIASRRGVNVPGAHLSIPAITEKDLKDLDYAVGHGADYVALSFVRSPKDVLMCKEILASRGSSARVISKIETVEAMDDLEAIIEASDGVMVARGDLAVEIGFEHVPLAQRRIIKLARKLGKFSIVATQMLDSMEKSPIPTRAEASDVAYAVLDGANALMLSGETAIGQYPAESIKVMRMIADAAEVSTETGE